MDTNQTQIKRENDFSLRPITEQLIGAAFEVHNVLGYGFLERVYQRAMQVELQSRRIKVELEPRSKVDDKIIVELKTDPAYQSIHEAQLLNELRGTGTKLGFLINFGRERVEYKRMIF